MQENYNIRRGAIFNYAVFLCVASVLLVSAIAYLGNEFEAELTAWNQNVEIDYTTVATIKGDPQIKTKNSITKIEISPDNTKTYRVYQLPKGLLTEE